MPPDNSNLESRTTDVSAVRLEQAMKTNRLLLGALIIVLIAAAAVGGWLVGRERPGVPGDGHSGEVHPNCPTDLPPRGQALARGIRCNHGTLIVDAHCEDGHGMKRFILELIQQKASDDEIKAALLRRYGDKALAGRDWEVKP